MFDGPHGEQDQYDGIVLPQPALAKTYILIVDDWNWPEVREGTERALHDLELSADLRIEIRTNFNDTPPGRERVREWRSFRSGRDSEWHNGYLFVVVSQAFV